MTPDQYWFISIVCTLILLDLLAWKQRRAIDKKSRRYWQKRDADSQARHEEFMAAMDKESRR